jgi:acrylyl-CoA reductase (NADPH)
MGDWLVPVPEGMTTREAMGIGTAGYTAMLCVMALERLGMTKERGDILVTGATGGVGSIAVAILARLGYRVVASTGKASERAYLGSLGAAEILDRNSLSQPGKPLQKERWAGVVDCVGSHTLANACAQTKSEGAVASCGLAQGMDFPATVAPFILRGVALKGVNSVTAPPGRRIEAWRRLATDLEREKLRSMIAEVALGDVIGKASEVVTGKVRGRILVDVNR